MKPWTLKGSEILEDGVSVIVVRHEWFDQEEDSKRWQFTPACKARARLAAAAPRLADALRAILEIGKRDLSNPKYDSYFNEARAAIAAAGEQP